MASIAVLAMLMVYFSQSGKQQSEHLKYAGKTPMAINLQHGLGLYNVCMRVPETRYNRTLLEHAFLCRGEQTKLNAIFDESRAATDAQADFENGEIRLIGRVDNGGAGLEIPGIECASAYLRKALYPSSCLILSDVLCGDYSKFDGYAEVYNKAVLRGSNPDSEACK